MATRQYIGARYVMKVYENSLDEGSAEWEANTSYEPFTLVTFQNSSYLSKKPVPEDIGDPATNPRYWVITGAYNGQIASLQNQINLLGNIIGDLEDLQTIDKDSIVNAINEVNEKAKTEQFDNAPSNTFKYYGSVLELDSQGICVDDNNIIYIASLNTTPNCTITRALLNGTVLDTHSNLRLYHANDMTYLNGKLYVASTRSAEGAANANKKIAVLDLATWNTIDIDPFANEPYRCIFGVTKYDETHLICGLGSENVFSDVGLFMLDVNTLEYEEITISNSKNLYLGFYSYLQSIEYYDGKCYILTSATNSLIEISIDGNVGEITNVINIGGFYDNGLPIGETEGISLLAGDFGSIFLTSSVVVYDGYFDTKLGLFSPYGNAPDCLLPDDIFFNLGGANDIYVNGSTNSVMEVGTPSYPFKRLMDAIIVCNNPNPLFVTTGIIKAASGTYKLPRRIDNMKFTLMSLNEGDKVHIYNSVVWYNCDAAFDGRDAEHTEESAKEIIFDGDAMEFKHCNVEMVNTESNQIITTNGTTINARNIYIKNYVWVAFSNAKLDITGTSIQDPNYLIRAESYSLVQAFGLAASLSKIDVGTATILFAGNPT